MGWQEDLMEGRAGVVGVHAYDTFRRHGKRTGFFKGSGGGLGLDDAFHVSYEVSDERQRSVCTYVRGFRQRSMTPQSVALGVTDSPGSLVSAS
jgi:hypothetical protein